MSRDYHIPPSESFKLTMREIDLIISSLRKVEEKARREAERKEKQKAYPELNEKSKQILDKIKRGEHGRR